MQIKATLRFILSYLTAKIKKPKNKQRNKKPGTKCWGDVGKGTPPSLLMELHSYTATIDISVDRYQQANNESTK